MNDFNQFHDLYHHGTKGQKWGLRRALWYPISAFKKSQTAEQHPLKPKADDPKSSEKSKPQSASSRSSSSSSGNTKSQTNATSSQDNKNTGQQPAQNQDAVKSKSNSNSEFRVTPTAPARQFSKSEKKLREKILADNNITDAYKNRSLFSTQELTDILTRSKAEQDMADFIKKHKSANAKAQAFLKNTNLYTASAAGLVKNTETITRVGKLLKKHMICIRRWPELKPVLRRKLLKRWLLRLRLSPKPLG